MVFHFGHPGAVDGDVVQLVPVVILQIVVNKVFYGSPLNSGNGEHPAG